MGAFSNRTASVLTKHGKEHVLNTVLGAATGLEVKCTNAYDTDLLGSFTLETPRYGSQLDAARKKAQIGMKLLRFADPSQCKHCNPSCIIKLN